MWPDYLTGVKSIDPPRHYYRECFSLKPGTTEEFEISSWIKIKESDAGNFLEEVNIFGENTRIRADQELNIARSDDWGSIMSAELQGDDRCRMKIGYNSKGDLFKLIFEISRIGVHNGDKSDDVRLGSVSIKSMLETGETIELAKNDVSLNIKPAGDKVEIMEYEAGRLIGVIHIPTRVNPLQIEDRLVLPQTIDDPVNASPAFDKSWKRDLKPALGISWISLR